METGLPVFVRRQRMSPPDFLREHTRTGRAYGDETFVSAAGRSSATEETPSQKVKTRNGYYVTGFSCHRIFRVSQTL